jgi:hypothetical protein
MRYVRLTKISSAHHGLAPSAGSTLKLTLPGLPALTTGYTVDGWLVTEPQIAHPVLVWRLVRNGDVVPGLLVTSLVTEIGPGTGFTTLNSHYVYAPVTPVRWPHWEHLGPIDRAAFRTWLLVHPSTPTLAPPDAGRHFHPADYLAWKFPRPA